jgi:hypothetical protein
MRKTKRNSKFVSWSYHTLANDKQGTPLPPYPCWTTATNHDQSGNLVDFRSRWDISHARSGTRTTPTLIESPIFLQLPASTLPAGPLGAESGRPGWFGLSPNRQGAGTIGISATDSIATVFAGTVLSTVMRQAESKKAKQDFDTHRQRESRPARTESCG